MEIALQKELGRIVELLTDLSKYIGIKYENGEYGISVILENILRGFFNILLDCNLKNLNFYQKNYPAVDLGDYDKRIAFQITGTGTWEKVRETIVGIKKNEKYREFDTIYIFLCTTKEKPNLDQKKIDELTGQEFHFPKENVLVIEDLYRIISLTKDLNQIKKARKYLERHLLEQKKRFRLITFLTVIALMVIITAFLHGASSFLHNTREIEMDSHLLLELENANHQYEEGLENWRRLDYNRAYRDISEAKDEISEHFSQAEVEVAKLNNSLGCLCLDMGRYEEAYDLLNSARVTFQDVFGNESIEARAIMFSIAQYDYYTGDFETALKTAQEIIDASNPKKDMIVITTISHFRAMVFDSLGDYASAISVYEEILSLYDNILDDGELSKEFSDYVHDPELDQGEKDYYTNALEWIILTYNNMGQVYIHLEEYDVAAEILEKGIDLSVNNIYIGQQNLTASKLYSNLAIVEAKRGEGKAAIDNIDLAMRIQEKLFDFTEEYPGLAEVNDIYGTLLMDQGRYEDAKEHFDRALQLAQKYFGENHPHTAEAYNALGTYWYNCGKYTEAADAFEQAVTIRKNIIGKEHPDTVKYYINLARAQIGLGEINSAFTSLMEAEEICDECQIIGKLPEQIEDYRKEAALYE